MTIPTTEKLARMLEEAGAPREMIGAARCGRFDDYKSISPSPITDLVHMAEQYSLHDIAELAKAGEFDSTQEEAEAWFEAEGRKLLEGE